MIAATLRLQQQCDPGVVTTRSDEVAFWRFRFALPNGWHCGHWHETPETAAACIRAQLPRRG